jgi:uncharacterized membrane protein
MEDKTSKAIKMARSSNAYIFAVSFLWWRLTQLTPVKLCIYLRAYPAAQWPIKALEIMETNNKNIHIQTEKGKTRQLCKLQNNKMLIIAPPIIRLEKIYTYF